MRVFFCFVLLFISYNACQKQLETERIIRITSMLPHTSCFDLVASHLKFPYSNLLYIMFYTRILYRIFT